MVGQSIICARVECAKPFKKATHNQKYCSNECCRIETNKNIMKKYHERNAIKRGKKRVCKTCGTNLSRYNVDDNCSSCKAKTRKENIGEASRLLASVSWL